MDKDNKHPFGGSKVVFATQHQKDKILAPLFKQVGLFLFSADVNTDLFGTFSGEVERKGSVRETLRLKINLALTKFPSERFFLASEGSFGGHPLLGFGSTNLESLLFYDHQNQAEVYAEYLSEDVCFAEKIISPAEDYQDFLKSIFFPSTGVIVHPINTLTPIFKGLHNLEEIKKALQTCFSQSSQVKLSTDLRAHHNPNRQKVIYKAGEKLLEILSTFCPQCSYPGFSITRALPGLLCRACKTPSRITKDVIFECPACEHNDTKPRPDGLKFIEPDECEVCNP